MVPAMPTGDAPRQERFSSGPNAPAAARRYVRALLGPTLDAERLEDMELIVSELVTNAYLYGTAPGDSVLVTVAAAFERVRLEVHNPAHRHPHPHPAPVPVADGGRGLFIVEALAARWGVQNGPHGTAVWAEVKA